MTDVMTLPRGRPLTAADLDDRPDDGHRYELIDGVLVVSPAPAPVHQRVVLALSDALRANRPSQLRVYVAPLDVAISDLTVLEPDLLVANRDAITERGAVGPPVLAVEVLSPSTRRVDLTWKKATYEAAGTLCYVVVDPQAPSATAWRLHEGTYVLVGHADGDEVLELDVPYPIRLVPATLVADD